MTTTITKTIGAGQNYTTVQAWYDGINTDAGGTNLVSLDVAAVGKVVGNLTGTLLTSSTLYTTDATRNITLTGNAAETYSGGLNWNTAHGPSITSADTTNGTINISQPFFVISNLQINCTGNAGAVRPNANSITIDSCVITASAGGAVILGTVDASHLLMKNNLV